MADDKNKSIHSGHRERMRSRFLKDPELSGFAEHEIMELILFFVFPRGDTNAVAHRLLDTFGSVNAVVNAPVEKLAKVENIGQNSAVMLKMLGSVAKYLDKQDLLHIDVRDIPRLQPYKGDIPKRPTGSLVAFETGEAVTYGLYNAQERGELFITPGTQVYEGMIVGSSPKQEDLIVNVCKKKHLTNTRASGSDDALRLTPPRVLSLEDSLEFLAEDELLEVTPKNIRIRKKTLSNTQRAKDRAKINV